MIRTCAWCEYFDGGGLAKVEKARRGEASIDGDCLNRQSPRFQTKNTQTRVQFVVDSNLSPMEEA